MGRPARLAVGGRAAHALVHESAAAACSPDSLPPVPPGGEVVVPLPGDALPFMAGHEAALGDYRLCSLFSPVLQFADQASACNTAEEVLKLLFPAAQPTAPDLSRRRLFGLGR
jgi:[NiFe] hydrogenase assembly HybE family chaperone